MLKAFVTFFTTMDVRAVRAIGIGVTLLAVLVAGFILGQFMLDESAARTFLDRWLEGTRDSGWGLPAVIILFVVAAFFFAPQTLLIGVVVLVFGFSKGFAFAWTATMVSSTFTYWLGRQVGAETLNRIGGGVVARVSKFVGANGFTASAIIRMVPTAPFIMVNMALGAAGVRPAAFVAGTAIGIIPKAMIVSAIAGGLLEVSEGGDVRIALALAALAVVWLGVIFIARKRLRAHNP